MLISQNWAVCVYSGVLEKYFKLYGDGGGYFINKKIDGSKSPSFFFLNTY